jgi:hypothetical protein
MGPICKHDWTDQSVHVQAVQDILNNYSRKALVKEIKRINGFMMAFNKDLIRKLELNKDHDLFNPKFINVGNEVRRI